MFLPTTLLGVLLPTALGYAVIPPPLTTEHTYAVGTAPWPQYPRPLLTRPRWRTLNGVWKWAASEVPVGINAAGDASGGGVSGSDDGSVSGSDGSSGDAGRLSPYTSFTKDVLVPSCLESGLSGVMLNNQTYSWFAREFTVPEEWGVVVGGGNGDEHAVGNATGAGNGTGKHGGGSGGEQRLMLNFEAVDYQATVYVNGRLAGSHEGGYWHFSIDVTDFLVEGVNVLHVAVFDPTDLDDYKHNIPLGKQRLVPSHIFYTACTGIWQSVWMEPVPAAGYVRRLDVAAGMDGEVNMTVVSSSGTSSVPVTVTMTDAHGAIVATHSARSDAPFVFSVKSSDLQLWTPDSPALYNLSVTLGDGQDTVGSYTGFRTISSGRDRQGVMRPLLNGEFVFYFGTLDQGYWPDGIYTPPTYEAMVGDLEALKGLGANAVRKHMKVEPDLFYQACDRLGLLVLQDMPALLDATVPFTPSPPQQAEFERQLALLVAQHRAFPSVAVWVLYNEGWGQLGGDGRLPQDVHPEVELARRVREELDPGVGGREGVGARLVDAATGWYDHGAGDFSDNHHYSSPQCGTPWYSTLSRPYDPKRIALQGEFGGLGNNVSIEHLWNVPAALDTIDQTYELDADAAAWNYRAHALLAELRAQVERHACSGAVYTQTTDVEGEVNGLLTYDRRVLRPDRAQWRADIQALYSAAAKRGGYKAQTVMGAG